MNHESPVNATAAEKQMRAWEAHMRSYCPGRQSAFELSAELIFSRIAPGAAENLRLADLGCGYGGWSAFVQTAAQARDLKPQFTALDSSAQRLQVYQTLLGPASHILQGDFLTTLPELCQSAGPVLDAVFFGWAAHEIPAAQLQDVYARIHQALKPGGLLLIADFMTGLQPAAEALALELTHRRRAQMMADPELQRQEQALHTHTRHEHGQPHQHTHPHANVRHYPPEEHAGFLSAAGFGLIEEVWRYLNNRMLLAIA
ncbi:MAG: class I SAM-dependent methyltransferase [Candidatus Sericytochromatia bacterium]